MIKKKNHIKIGRYTYVVENIDDDSYLLKNLTTKEVNWVYKKQLLEALEKIDFSNPKNKSVKIDIEPLTENYTNFNIDVNGKTYSKLYEYKKNRAIYEFKKSFNYYNELTEAKLKNNNFILNESKSGDVSENDVLEHHVSCEPFHIGTTFRAPIADEIMEVQDITCRFVLNGVTDRNEVDEEDVAEISYKRLYDLNKEGYLIKHSQPSEEVPILKDSKLLYNTIYEDTENDAAGELGLTRPFFQIIKPKFKVHYGHHNVCYTSDLEAMKTTLNNGLITIVDLIPNDIEDPDYWDGDDTEETSELTETVHTAKYRKNTHFKCDDFRAVIKRVQFNDSLKRFVYIIEITSVTDPSLKEEDIISEEGLDYEWEEISAPDDTKDSDFWDGE